MPELGSGISPLVLSVTCGDFEARLVDHLNRVKTKKVQWLQEETSHVIVNNVSELKHLDLVYRLLETKVQDPTRVVRVAHNTGTSVLEIWALTVSRLHQALAYRADQMLLLAVQSTLDRMAMVGFRVDGTQPAFKRYSSETAPLREFGEDDGNLTVIDRWPDRSWVRDSVAAMEPSVIFECRIGYSRPALEKLCEEILDGHRYVYVVVMFNVKALSKQGFHLEVLYRMRDEDDVAKCIDVTSTECNGRIFFPFDWLCDRYPGSEEFPDNTQVMLDADVLCAMVQGLGDDYEGDQQFETEHSINQAFQSLSIASA